MRTGNGHVMPPKDRTAILEELNAILTSRVFRSSRRCSALLNYLVTETIEGHGDSLKERTIGVAVFGRDPSYDTNADPIVRSSAVELRKRIALYYQQIGSGDRIRIDLPAGAYVPHFRSPRGEPLSLPSGPEAADEPAATEDKGAEQPAPSLAAAAGRRWIWALGAALVVIAAALVAWAATARSRAGDPFHAFWDPLLRASPAVTVALGGVSDPQTQVAGTELRSAHDVFLSDRVGFVDAMVMARIVGLLEARGKRVEIRRGGSLLLPDLRKMPTILIGGVTNPWLSLLTSGARFTLAWDSAAGRGGILDRKSPGELLGRSHVGPYSAMTQDYAIISRFVDPRLDQVVLLISGLGREGTQAAGDFVTQPRYLGALARRAPQDWRTRNFQVVIATDVVKGSAGPPRILATHFW